MSGKILKYSLRFALGLVLLVLLALLGIYIYFNTNSGKKYLSKLIIKQAEGKLGTEVKGDISFRFPDWVRIENALIKDDNKDSLLAAKSIYLDLDMWALKDNKLMINAVELNNTFLHIHKKGGKYNFDKILQNVNPPKKSTPDPSEPWILSLAKINSENLHVSFIDEEAKQNIRLRLGRIITGFDKLNPSKNTYHLKNTSLSDLFLAGHISPTSTTNSTTEKAIYDLLLSKIAIENLGVDVSIGDDNKHFALEKAKFSSDIPSLNMDSLVLEKILFKTNRLVFDKNNKTKKYQNEFDADHLDILDWSLDLNKIEIKESGISGQTLSTKLKEKTGVNTYLTLADFKLANDKLNVSEIKAQLNQSEIKGNLQLDFSQKNTFSYNSKIELADLRLSDGLLFNRQLTQNQNFKKVAKDKISFSGNFKGDLNQIFITNAVFKAPTSSTAKFDGSIKNFKKPNFNFTFKSLESTKKDVGMWVNLDAYNLPEKFIANGTVKGDLNQIQTDVNIASIQGKAKIVSEVNLVRENYIANVQLTNYKVGELIKNKDIGSVSGNIKVNGQSFKNPILKTVSHLNRIEYQGKTYENIDAIADIQDKLLTADITIKQADTEVKWQGKVDFSKENVQVEGKTQIAALNLKTLGLTDQDIAVQGDLDIKQFEWNPTSPLINLNGKNLRFIVDKKVYPISEIQVNTETIGDKKTIHVLTPFIDLDLQGAFSYASILQAIQQEVHHYFKIPGFTPTYSAEQTDVKIDAKLSYDSLFKAFAPGLIYFQPIEIHTFVNTAANVPLGGTISLPLLKYDSINIKNSSLKFTGNKEAITYDFISAEIQNKTYRIRNSSIEGKIQNDKADFNLSVKDEAGLKIHALKGYLNSINDGVRVFFDESGTLLSYQEWAGNPYGSFEYTKAGIKFNDVVFTNAEQILRLSSLNEEPNGPLAVFANNIDLNLLAKSFLRDSTLIAGKLDLDLEVLNYMGSEPAFTGDFSVENLIYKTYTLGQLQGKAESIGTEGVELMADLNDANQDLSFSGKYKPKSPDPFDFKLFVKKFDSKTLGIWTEGILQDLKGSIGGEFTLKGSPEKPIILGFAEAQNLQMRLVETGALLYLNNQKFKIEDNKIKLDQVEVKDKDFNLLLVNGLINITALPDYSYNLKLKSKDFKIIDAVEGQNTLFMGQGYVDTDIQIVGKNLDFKCTGDIALKDKTDLTLLTEEEGKAQSEMDQIVTFVQKIDSTIKKTNAKEESKINFANSVNVNLDIRKEAKIKILIDAVTGDLMEANGTGKLNVGFDNQGNLFVIGRFGIINGKYNLTYQVINREFMINKNSESNITWNGDPLAGILDITAFYQVKGKTTIPVLEDKKIQAPVRVDLILSGELMNPNVNFELVLNESDIGTNKETLAKDGFVFIKNGKKEEAEVSATEKEKINNRAVFLLVTNTLNTEEFISSFTNQPDLENTVRQKASEVISKQLNSYASSIIKGLDIDLGIDSKLNSHPGTNARNTNVKLGISKKIANERLILAVGKNFEIENSEYRSDQIFDNLQADWLVTKDGRYRINAFRKNLTNLVIEGTVVETGLGFVIAIDYDTWKELLKRNK